MEWLQATSRQVITVQLAIAAGMVGFAMILIVARTLRRSELSAEQRAAWHQRLGVGLLAVSAVAALNYFYVSRSRQFLHRWDLFHTVMTTRYFEELGYTKLYECAYVFDQRGPNRLRDVKRIRDLETLRHKSTRHLVEQSDCEKRFTPERRASFLRDLEFFYRLTPSRAKWKRVLGDKGYNGTPLYTAVVRALVGGGELSLTRLHLLALLDVVLILFAFFLLYRFVDPVVALGALIFFCVNFPNRFTHMGGSILRFDYVVFLILAVVALRRSRYGLAGALVALSGMERGFPVLFAVGLFVKAIYDLVSTRRVARRYLWFFGAFVATAVICFGISLTTSGFDSWQGFVDNIRLHTSRSAGFRIGFRHMFMMDGNLTGPDGFLSFEAKAALFASRTTLYYALVIAFLAPLALVVRRVSDVTFGVVFFLLSFFLLMVATRYYYSVLVLVLLLDYDLLRERWYAGVWLLAFLMSVVAYGVYFGDAFAPFLYNTLFTSMLCVFFAYLLGALVVRHWRAGSATAT